MGLFSSHHHAALLGVLAVACASQLDESGVASDLEEGTGATNGGGSSGSGTSGSTAKGGSTASGKGGSGGSTGKGGSAGSSAGGSSAGTSSTAGTGGSSSGSDSGGTGGSGTSGTGGNSGGSGGSGTSGSGGVVSTGDCDQPSVTVMGDARCGDTFIYNNKLYTCISAVDELNQQECGPAGVYCNNTAPDHNPFGPQAWQFVEDC